MNWLVCCYCQAKFSDAATRDHHVPRCSWRRFTFAERKRRLRSVAKRFTGADADDKGPSA